MYQAVLYQAASPEAEYIGGALYALTQNLRADVIQPVLERFGIHQVNPEQWYQQQLVLDVMREIEKRFTFEELVAIGVKAGEIAPLPPNVYDIESALLVANAIHKLSCRNIPTEDGIVTEKLSPTHFRMTMNIPTPPFLTYGLVFGLVRRFRQKDQSPTVVLTDKKTPFVIEVQW